MSTKLNLSKTDQEKKIQSNQEWKKGTTDNTEEKGL